MREWVKANGGPLSLVVLGLAIFGTPLPEIAAWVFVGVGLGWFLFTRPPMRRLLEKFPYRLVRKQRRYLLSPASYEAFAKAKEARRRLKLRVRSQVRQGREILGDCEEAAITMVELSQGLFGSNLRARVDRWTKDTEKLLEGGPDEYAERFHHAALQSLQGEYAREAERLVGMMKPRVAELERIQTDLEKTREYGD